MDVALPPGHIIMTDWNIVIIEYEGRVIEKFLGYSMQGDHFRFSSAILEYDPETNTGKTMSGSLYTFLTPPGKLHPLAQNAYNSFSQIAGVSVRLKYEV